MHKIKRMVEMVVFFLSAVKEIFYRITIGLAVLYGSDFRQLRNNM